MLCGLQRGTVLLWRNKDRTFDSTFPTLPERRGTQPGKQGALVASRTQHGTVDDINAWELWEG